MTTFQNEVLPETFAIKRHRSGAHHMPRKWSQEISGKFNLRLPPDVMDWCDSEVWKEESAQEYNQETCPDGSGIWGGAMLPDTLPFLGNGFGDCLCLRFGPDGAVSEVIRWLHEGATWTSYGNTLSEALLFDAALALEKKDLELPLYAEWAIKQLKVEPETRARLENDLSVLSLFEAGLAETAVGRELCKQACSSGLLKYCRRAGCGKLAKDLGVEWLEFSRWLVDTNMIPVDFRGKLAKATGIPVESLLYQDWEGAKLHALKIAQLRTDLCWPFAVLGWAAERNGELQKAIGYYFAGLKTLETSADFTETWAIGEFGTHKFALDRLRDRKDFLPSEVLQDSYVQACLTVEKEGLAVRNYWLQQGEMAERNGLNAHAFRCYYSAGWDSYCFDAMEMILEALVRTAQSAGWPALTKITESHLKSFRQFQTQ